MFLEIPKQSVNSNQDLAEATERKFQIRSSEWNVIEQNRND